MEYRTVMTIKGEEVPSSCVFMGAGKAALACAGRLNRLKGKHHDVTWKVLPAITQCEWTSCPTRVGNVCCNERRH